MKKQNFSVHIEDEEVPANDSKATGQTIFHFSKDEAELHYKLNVDNNRINF